MALPLGDWHIDANGFVDILHIANVNAAGNVVGTLTFNGETPNPLTNLAFWNDAAQELTFIRAFPLNPSTLYRALDARMKVLDAALVEADKLLQAVTADLEARRTTAQEATAMRLRVEELRQLSTDAHNQMSALPRPAAGSDLSGALTTFQKTDDQVEGYEAKQRWIQAFDVSLRAGLDEFLDRSTNPSPYFAVITVGINLGALLQGSANDRAAAGRRRLVRSGHDPLAVDATVERLKLVVETEAVRLGQTATLEADLKRQLDALAKVGGDESKRYRQTVWFDWIKVSAEHAYLDAHLAALRQVLGG